GVEKHLLDLRRLQGVGDEHLQRVVPADDVDALAAQLVHDVLDARAAHAHAGAHAIDLQVDAADGDLAAVAGLAGDGLDLDGAVGDLGDRVLEQPPHEVGVGPRQDDLDAVPGLLDLEDDRLDALADVVRLAGDLLAAGQDRLGLAQADDGGAALVALDGAVDQVALHGAVDVEDRGGLGLADFLDHDLLGGLGGDAAQLGRLDDLLAALGVHLAGVAVDDDLDALLLAVLLFHGQLHGGLDALEDDLARDALLVVH